jgi:hypothetical protein
MKKFLLLLAVSASLVFSINLSVQNAGPVKDPPVTSTIHNADSAGTPFRIQSDSRGAYKNGIDSVVSIVQSIGNWELDMLNSPTRKIFVDLGDPVPNTNPTNAPPPFTTALVPARFISKCTSSIFNLTAGATTLCPLAVAMNYGTQRYALRIQTVNYPGTQEVLWTCLSAAGGKCNSWKMQSDPAGQGKVAAQLLKITTSKGKTVEERIGQYYISFSIDVTNP